MSNGRRAEVASWVFGGAILIVLIAIIIVLPEPTPAQEKIIRFLLALSATFLSFFFVGKVLFKGKVVGQVVAATGGFALFILIMFFWNPSDIKT